MSACRIRCRSWTLGSESVTGAVVRSCGMTAGASSTAVVMAPSPAGIGGCRSRRYLTACRLQDHAHHMLAILLGKALPPRQCRQRLVPRRGTVHLLSRLPGMDPHLVLRLHPAAPLGAALPPPGADAPR